MYDVFPIFRSPMNNNPISVKCGPKGSRRGCRGSGKSSKSSADSSEGGGSTSRLTTAKKATPSSAARKSTGAAIKAKAKPKQKSQTTSIADCVQQPTPADLARSKDKDKECLVAPRTPVEKFEPPTARLVDPSRQDDADQMCLKLTELRSTIHDQRVLRQLACDIQMAQGELDALVEVDKEKQEQVVVEETVVETLVMEGPSHKRVSEEFGYCKVLARPPFDFRKWFWSYTSYCLAKSCFFTIFTRVLGDLTAPWWLKKIAEFWIDRTAEDYLGTFYPQSQDVLKANNAFRCLSLITTAVCPSMSSYTLFKFEVCKALSQIALVVAARLTETYWTKNLWRLPRSIRTPVNYLLGTAGYRYHSVHYSAKEETVLVADDKRSSIVAKDVLAHKYITLRKYERTVDVMENARWVEIFDTPSVLVEAATDANLPALLTQHGTRESLKARLDRTLQSYNIANYDKKGMYDNEYVHSSTQDYVFARAEHNLENSVELDFRLAPALGTTDIDQESFSTLNKLTSSTPEQRLLETPHPLTGNIDESSKQSATRLLLGLLGLSLTLILFQQKQGQLRDFAGGLLSPIRDFSASCFDSYRPSLNAISEPSPQTQMSPSKLGWPVEITQLGEKMSSWLPGMLVNGKCWIETLWSSLLSSRKPMMKPNMPDGSTLGAMNLSVSLDHGFKPWETLSSHTLLSSRRSLSLTDQRTLWEKFTDQAPSMVFQIIQHLKAILIMLSSAFRDSCTTIFSGLSPALSASSASILDTFPAPQTPPTCTSLALLWPKLKPSTDHA